MTDTPTLTLDDVNVTAKASTANPVATNNPTASVNPASAPYQPAAAPQGGDDLTLTIGNTNWSGWQRVQLTRSMETVPASFDIQVTEKYPTQPDIDIKPGTPCTVKIGGDLVLTGYVDRYSAVINAREHSVHISGRSKSADLVDCAAFVGDQSPTGERYQIVAGNTLGVIQQLAKPYGINVTSVAGDGVAIPQFNINLGETVWEIVDRITKFSQLVAYDMPDGSIVLAQAGNESMASGFTQGLNVEQAEITFTMDQRFSVYEGFVTPVLAVTTDNGGAKPPTAIATDPGVPRFRKRIIIVESSDASGLLVPKVVNWEAARRAGRSNAVVVTCDSWRDASNNLWTPNHLVPVSIAALKIPNVAWVIGQVTYIKNESGRHAIVVIMPANAFLPEPIVFQPLPPTAQALGYGNANNPAAKAPAPAANNNPTSVNPTGGAGGPF